MNEILNRVPRLSKSLKVIGSDTDRSATYDFLLNFP